MIPEIGLFFLCLAFALSTLGIIGISLFRAIYPEKALRAILTNAWLVIGLCTAAFGVLVYSYSICDFSVSSVVLNSSIEQPLFYRIAAVWSNHEGSMMLWLLFLQGTLALLALQKIENPSCKFWALFIQTALIGLFLGFILNDCQPFKRFFPIPVRGLGLNPALYDVSLGIHPPTLYSALVGYSGLFSLSMAGAISQQFVQPQQWAAHARPWALHLWWLQTAGIALGSWWAYYELGWGGWWAWDPVENVSLFPWLIGLGLMHCLNPPLLPLLSPPLLLWMGTGPFLSAVFGTFLVRSGAISSLHSFAADLNRSLLLMVLFGVLAVWVFFLQSSKLTKIRQNLQKFSWKNPLTVQLLFLAGCGASLGVSFILLMTVPSFVNSSLSLHAGYFKTTFMPFFLGLMVFMPWGYSVIIYKKIPSALQEKFLFCGCISLSVGLFFLSPLPFYLKLSPSDPIEKAIGFGVSVWVISATGILLRERYRHSIDRFSLSQMAGLLSHGGVGLFLLGATAQTFCSFSDTLMVQIGETASFDSFYITLKSIQKTSMPLYDTQQAILNIQKENQSFDLKIDHRFFPLHQRSHSKTVIHSLGISDLYIAMGETVSIEGFPTKYFFSVYKNTFIHFVWWGAFLMALGALINGFTRRRSTKTV